MSKVRFVIKTVSKLLRYITINPMIISHQNGKSQNSYSKECQKVVIYNYSKKRCIECSPQTLVI